MPANCTQSESSYMGGCRCDDCRQAHTDRERERRHSKRRKDAPAASVKDAIRKAVLHHDDDTYTLADIRRARGWDD